MPFWAKKILGIISTLLNLLRLVYVPVYGHCDRIFHVHLKRMYTLFFFFFFFYYIFKISSKSNCSIISFGICVALLIFCLGRGSVHCCEQNAEILLIHSHLFLLLHLFYFFFFSFFSFFFFFFCLGLPLLPMQVPRKGVESSYSCQPMPQSQQCQICLWPTPQLTTMLDS